MTEGIRQLAYTYTIAYIDCHQQKVKANKERFEYLLEQLEVAQEKRGWWNWIKERWYASKKEDVEAYLKNCEEVFQLRREVAELYELVNSWEDLQQRYREIKSIWDAYWETLGRNDNIASYEGGKLFIFVASALVPGLGQLSKAKRVKAILEELKGFTKTRWDELVARVRGGLGGVGRLVNQIDNTLSRLVGKAKYVLNNTGEYKIVGGHHPIAKKAFEGDLAYDYQKAFSVSTDAVGGQAIHSKITGQQNSLYTAWKKANPNAKLTIDTMADIEIQAMKNVGIPEDVATGWVVKALEDLKAQGVTEIKNIPWNGVN